MSTGALGSIGGVQQLAASLSNLGTELSSAAPTGQFESIFTQINSEISVLDGGTPTTPAAVPGPVTSLPSGLGALSGGGQVSAASLDPAAAALTTTGLTDLAGATGTTASAGPTGSEVVADARKYLGVPYQWGGTDPSTGLDCSGLVQLVYSNLGIHLPRTSEQQATVGTPVASVAQAQPGDLVFYEPSASGPGHVGIYIGNGQMIDAPHTGTDVQIQGVGQPSEIRRIIPAQGAAPAQLTSSSVGAGTGSPGMDRLGVPAALQPLFSAAGTRYGVDPVLLAAVAKQESGFQTGVVSSAGAQGLMQLMPATAAGLGVSPLDPASAIDGAAQLLASYLHDYGGSVPDALAAYNAGPGAVAAYGGVPPYAETENYVSNITSMLASARSVTQ